MIVAPLVPKGEGSMSADAALARLRSLALRHRMSLGVMHSARPRDFALMMATASRAFAAGHAYSEREVNDRLRAWLAEPGAMLAVDHVELRRWLVDTGVLCRDGFGRAYEPGTPRPDIAAAMVLLAECDVAALLTAARAQDAARRGARKAQWAKAKADDA